MKRNDFIAGIVGGIIFVTGCTVGILGYQKMNAPRFAETSTEDDIQNNPVSTYDNTDIYAYRDEPFEEEGTESEDSKEYVSTDRLTPEGGYTGQESSETGGTVINDSDLSFFDSEIVTPVADETNDVTGEQYNSAGNDSYFDIYNNPEQQNTSDSYVLNTSTMKIHHPNCNDVVKINPDNYATSNSSTDELIAQGYTLCGHCFGN